MLVIEKAATTPIDGRTQGRGRGYLHLGTPGTSLPPQLLFEPQRLMLVVPLRGQSMANSRNTKEVGDWSQNLLPPLQGS